MFDDKVPLANSKYILEIIVFMCGAVVMIFELVGSRIIAPYVGTSTYVWTSLIGVILASLSIGYYSGGCLADKKPSASPLVLIILFSSLAVAFSALAKDIVSIGISLSPATLNVKSIMISLTLFAPTSFLLGMVSPYAIRIRMNDITKAGRTAGNLYATSTAGSIFGTFLGGFYIIPNFGSTNSLSILSVVLLFAAALLLFYGRIGTSVLRPVFPAIIFLLGLTYAISIIQRKFLVADIDTEYSRIWVFNTTDSLTKKEMRVLTTGPNGVQAAMFTDGTNDLVFDYTKFYRLFSHFMPHPANALMIGGSAYTYPRDFIKNNPNVKLEVVEIDPGTTKIARKYFGLKDEKNLVIHHQDARIYLNDNKTKYDVIFVDAFNSAVSIPFQLTTKEAVRKEYDALNDGGVVMVNIISAIEGEKGKFARAEYATYDEIFPQVFLFPVNNINNVSQRQNVMLVGLKSKKIPEFKSTNKEIDDFLSRVWKKPIVDDVPVLTDDFAPVEFYSNISIL